MLRKKTKQCENNGQNNFIFGGWSRIEFYLGNFFIEKCQISLLWPLSVIEFVVCDKSKLKIWYKMT